MNHASVPSGCVYRYVLFLLYDCHSKWNAFSSVLFHLCIALLAVDIDPALSLGFRRVLQLLRQPVHISFEVFQWTKGSWIQSHEEVSDVGLCLVDIHSKPGS